MSEADGAEPKPSPLRVPVLDVPVRTSILAPEGDSASTSADASSRESRPSVIPHPVRVVSDRPSSSGNGATPESGGQAAGQDEGPLELSPMEVAAEEAVARESAAAQASPPYGDAIPPHDAIPSIDPAETLELEPDDDAVEESPRVSAAQPPPPPAATTSGSPSPPPERSSRPSLTMDEEEDENAVVIDLTQDESGASEEETADELEPLSEEEQEAAAVRRSQATPPPPPTSRGPSGAAHRVADLKPSKPRKQAWWETFFNDDYLRSVRAPGREAVARKADFVEQRLGLSPGATVLDVGCGWGSDVVELSTRGYLGVGLDLSLAMLSRAADEAQERGQRINFLHADMREMNFDGTFDAVMCLGTTFGYFDDDTNRQVIGRLRRALKPQGVLLLETVNRDHVIRSQPNLVWFEGDGCVCMEESEFNYFTSRLHVKRTVILDDGRQRENEYSVRLYSLHELGKMLHHQGFRVTEVSGRLAVPGVFFGQESPGLLVVAERRVDGTGKHSIPPLEEAFEEEGEDD